MDNQILLWIFAAILVAVGLAGLVIPLLPGAPLVFLGLLIAAWAENFSYVGVGTLIALAAMAALSYVCEVAATAYGARRHGASQRGVIGAAVGTVIGIFFGLFGILLGPFIGAAIGELTLRRDLDAATRAGWGATVGLALATAGKLALGIAMIGVFLIVRFVHYSP